MLEPKLNPCPFCGAPPTILICDEEGNIRDDLYKEDPWNGLRYALRHEKWDNGYTSESCPIATNVGEVLGAKLYESVEELARNWNGRVTGRKYDDNTDIREGDIIRMPEMAHGLKVYFSDKYQAFVCEDTSNNLVYELNTFKNMIIRKDDGGDKHTDHCVIPEEEEVMVDDKERTSNPIGINEIKVFNKHNFPDSRNCLTGPYVDKDNHKFK